MIKSRSEVVNDTLSSFTIYVKYSKYLPNESRRETWSEMCIRNMNMHLDKYPQMTVEILNLYNNYIIPKKLLPSMRSLQFSGKPIELCNSRIFNCAYLPVDDIHAFSETMFLLLGGTGVGYSVQNKHIKMLPKILKPTEEYRYLIQDSIIGWSDAIKVLIKSYFEGGTKPLFDYSDIRAKGQLLKTSGGKAPGHEGLKEALEKIETILESKRNGSRLTSIEVHDIQCHIAESVLSGGIRRSAMISFFDMKDDLMLNCKAGDWYINNPQRAMANNSAVVVRHKVKRSDFDSLWDRVKASGSGEPGIVFTNNPDMLGNPCFEIALKPFQFCNLVEINASDITTQEELEKRVRAATLLSTLQAGYTNFHYLRPIWKETTEDDALLGVSMTGIASGGVLKLDLEQAAKIAIQVNAEIANKIGINPAKRITTVKPAGTTSLVLGSSSGVHAWYSPYFIRRIRLNKEEAVYKHILKVNPELLEDCVFNPKTTAIISFPIKAPEGSIFRNESSLDLLERVKKLHNEWIKPAHISGDNTHNVSTTVTIKDNEWDEVRDWMWENKHCYNGISVLPYDSGTYQQTPFEEITKEQYEELLKKVKDIDFSQIIEEDDNTDLTGEIACGAGGCEIK